MYFFVNSINLVDLCEERKTSKLSIGEGAEKEAYANQTCAPLLSRPDLALYYRLYWPDSRITARCWRVSGWERKAVKLADIKSWTNIANNEKDSFLDKWMKDYSKHVYHLHVTRGSIWVISRSLGRCREGMARRKICSLDSQGKQEDGMCRWLQHSSLWMLASFQLP